MSANIFDELKLTKPYLILAPMAGITSLPYRTLNRMYGCEAAFTEMISAVSLGFENRKTLQMLGSRSADRPLGVQLLGSEIFHIDSAMKMLDGHDYDILDLNAACPTKKVVNGQKGAALLKEPKKLQGLIHFMVKNSSKPVTAKIRIGWDSSSDAERVAHSVEDGGAKAVFVHGRTKVQGYRGRVDHDSIRRIKKSLTIPVIASGDILDAELAKKMLDETGADGILIARGALGNPWLFRSIREYLKDGTRLPYPSMQEISEAMKKHLSLTVEFYGETRGIIFFRKFYNWYTRGFPKIKKLRAAIGRVKTEKDMIDAVNSFIHHASSHPRRK